MIGAGNRSQDSAIVRPMSSALVNRMVHVHLVSSARDWLAWARRSGIHPWVLDYISQRPDHLAATPPRHEEPFSTDGTTARLPAWFMIEVARDLPRIAGVRPGAA